MWSFTLEGEKKACSRKKEKGRDEGTRGKNEEEEKGFVVIEGKKRKDMLCVSFRTRQPRSPTHKVDKKEKDRTAMRLWFTPHRMTDPLSGASFNALARTNERTLIIIARA